MTAGGSFFVVTFQASLDGRILTQTVATRLEDAQEWRDELEEGFGLSAYHTLASFSSGEDGTIVKWITSNRTDVRRALEGTARPLAARRLWLADRP
jgi:hypothetical protein